MREGAMISVIVPVYNVKDYLIECVDSILMQSYRNFEIILVDDGSTDGSGTICDNIQSEHQEFNITVVHKSNGGLSSARNAGIEKANGLYYVFVDSDDALYEDYLLRLYTTAIEYNADIVACSFEKGEIFKKQKNIDFECDSELRIGSDIIDKIHENDVVVTVAWNKLYHNKFFKKYGLVFPNGLIHEDMYFTPQALVKAERFVILNEKLYFYRVRENSIMTADFTPKKLDILTVHEFRIMFFKNLGKEKLLKFEFEGYIRKCEYLISMINGVNEQYRSVIIDRLKKLINQYNVWSYISLKYKLRLLSLKLKYIGIWRK